MIYLRGWIYFSQVFLRSSSRRTRLRAQGLISLRHFRSPKSVGHSQTCSSDLIRPPLFLFLSPIFRIQSYPDDVTGVLGLHLNLTQKACSKSTHTNTPQSDVRIKKKKHHRKTTKKPTNIERDDFCPVMSWDRWRHVGWRSQSAKLSQDFPFRGWLAPSMLMIWSFLWIRFETIQTMEEKTMSENRKSVRRIWVQPVVVLFVNRSWQGQQQVRKDVEKENE